MPRLDKLGTVSDFVVSFQERIYNEWENYNISEDFAVIDIKTVIY
jgi:hypothetical protein